MSPEEKANLRENVMEFRYRMVEFIHGEKTLSKGSSEEAEDRVYELFKRFDDTFDPLLEILKNLESLSESGFVKVEQQVYTNMLCELKELRNFKEDVISENKRFGDHVKLTTQEYQELKWAARETSDVRIPKEKYEDMSENLSFLRRQHILNQESESVLFASIDNLIRLNQLLRNRQGAIK